MDLPARLRRRIQAQGPIPFDEWMEACLYDPDHGYYTRPGRKTGAGPDADFATSPTLHPFLGQAVAREIVEAWIAAGRPDPWHVVEYGGGEGDLARAALAHLDETDPPLAERTKWHHVEASPFHRAMQVGDARIDWDATRSDFVVAHEFLDALPFHWLERTQAGWSQVGVTWQDGFAATLVPACREALAALPPETDEAPVGHRVASMPRARDWLHEVAGARRVLVIDYGGPSVWARDPHGTVRTYARQQDAGDPLMDPGEKDITASIDTLQLDAWAQKAGMRILKASSQEEWLLGHGILDALNNTPRDSPEGAGRYLRLRQLLLPTGLGAAFQVRLLQGLG